MTVAELREILASAPQDAEVHVSYDSGCYCKLIAENIAIDSCSDKVEIYLCAEDIPERWQPLVKAG